MVTALITYGTNVASTTLSSAAQLANALGGSAVLPTNLVGTAMNWGQLYGKGNAGAWLAHSGAVTDSACNPDGNGYLWDVTSLEGQFILAGTWTPIVRGGLSAHTCTADIVYRAFKRSSGGVYTAIGSWTVTGTSWVNANANFSPVPSSVAAMSFATGDKLYCDVWANITASTMQAGDTMRVSSSSTTLGLANAIQCTTPGYNPTIIGGTMGLVGVG